MAKPKWFAKFADVPGVDYQPLVPVKRTSLPGHNAQPTVNQYDFDGRRHISLTWPSKGGSTSQSPANQHESASSVENSSSKELLQHLAEVLELPGVLTDYHFAIQGCAGRLWSLRREDPQVLKDVENLSWLDIRLIEAHPDLFKADFGDDDTWPAIAGFGYLIRLYSREGYIREALDVATRASRFKQHLEDRDSLQARVALLEGEERK